MSMAILSCRLKVAHVDSPPPDFPSSPRCGPRRQHHSLKESRRRYLLGTSLAGAFFLVATTPLDKSIPEYPPKSPLIEQLLERSRANKAKYDQQRLDSYYERNFKEYFEFVEGTIKNKTDLTETEKGILKWLEKTRSQKK